MNNSTHEKVYQLGFEAGRRYEQSLSGETTAQPVAKIKRYKWSAYSRRKLSQALKLSHAKKKLAEQYGANNGK